jgi:hypothetical protein
MGISWIVARVIGTGIVNGWGRYIVTSAPNQYLLLTVLLHCFDLVQSSQTTIVPFVEFPCLVDGDP